MEDEADQSGFMDQGPRTVVSRQILGYGRHVRQVNAWESVDTMSVSW